MAEKITITSYDQQGNIPKDFTGEVTFAIPGQTAKTRSYIEGSMKSGKFGQEEWAEGFKIAEYDPTNRQYVATEIGRRYAFALTRPENRNIFARDPQGAKQAIELLKMQGQSIPDWLIAAAQGTASADGSAGDGTGNFVASDGKSFSNYQAYSSYQAKLDQQKSERQSAFDLLFQQFSQYGLGGLVEPLRGLIESGVSPSEFTIKLRETDAYKKRFAANQARIQKGLRALSEAEYIGLEDQYQDVMRRYGLPDTYYTRGDMGRQEGFEKFIGGDVSPVELEDRIQTAQRRVINAAPEITASLRSFYPEIGQGDLLAYFLDPDKAIENIKRKVTAAEIGGAATMAGLATGAARAEELGRYGVTGEAARQGFQTVASVLPRGSQLAEIYKQSPYTQTTAEQEVFGLAGAAEAGRQRRKLTELEQAAFSGQAGAAGGALARDRAGAF